MICGKAPTIYVVVFQSSHLIPFLHIHSTIPHKCLAMDPAESPKTTPVAEP